MGKLEDLRHIIRSYGSALVCFSGGVDSTFLLKVAADELGDKCWAFTAASLTMAASEAKSAADLAKDLVGERYVAVNSGELEKRAFRENTVDRCYYCKHEAVSLARIEAHRLGLAEVLIGTNADEIAAGHRPGARAAHELGAKSPLVEVGLNKAEIRELSRFLGLRTWDKPQIACLSSRFPYGTEIKPERLLQVDTFEDGLHRMGFGQLRVRYHDQVARLELLPEEWERAADERTAIVALGKSVGFDYVAIDLEGFRTGSMNEPLVRIRTAR